MKMVNVSPYTIHERDFCVARDQSGVRWNQYRRWNARLGCFDAKQFILAGAVPRGHLVLMVSTNSIKDQTADSLSNHAACFRWVIDAAEGALMGSMEFPASTFSLHHSSCFILFQLRLIDFDYWSSMTGFCLACDEAEQCSIK